MTDLTPDAALIIARWCWPGRNWYTIADDDGAHPIWDDPCSHCGERKRPKRTSFYIESDDIRVAELVLIERGLAGEYGDALAEELDVYCNHNWEDNPSPAFAKLATAPLDARVRAILTVIDERP